MRSTAVRECRCQLRLANIWPILSRAPGINRISPELPAREPANPNTCITLLTGGLLVRIQPEEPLLQFTAIDVVNNLPLLSIRF